MKVPPLVVLWSFGRLGPVLKVYRRFERRSFQKFCEFFNYREHEVWPWRRDNPEQALLEISEGPAGDGKQANSGAENPVHPRPTRDSYQTP